MSIMNADAVYIHVPFCRKKCSYCDFYSLACSDNLIPDYLDSLKREISAASPVSMDGAIPLQTVYFGGGTPSLIPAVQIGEILNQLRGEYGLAAEAEITLEANPESITDEYLQIIAAAGVNRLSLGLQAVQERLLKLLGRIHNAADFQYAVTSAQAAGIRNISADLMIGLPGQTIKDIGESLDFLFALPIDHVSFYSLIIEPDTLFYEKYSGNSDLLPDDAEERAMYHYVIRRLAEAGMKHYEISNAARCGYESKHNLVYWHARPYYGFGPSAHSYLNYIRRANCSSLRQYISSWQQNDNPFSAATIIEHIDEQESQKEMLLLGLRLLDGVSFSSFAERFNVDMYSVFGEKLNSLVSLGLLIMDEKGVRLSNKGLDFANQVFMEFV